MVFVVLKAFTWLCIQVSFLVGVDDHVVQKIELRGTVCETSTLPKYYLSGPVKQVFKKRGKKWVKSERHIGILFTAWKCSYAL